MLRRKIIVILIFLIIIGIIFTAIIFKSGQVKEDLPENLYQKAQMAYKQQNYSKAIKIYNKIIHKYPDYYKIPHVYYRLATAYKDRNQLIKSRNMLELIINKYSDSDIIQAVQEELENLNIKILFSPIDTKNSIMYEVKKKDTLGKIAKKYNTTVELIKKSNNLEKDTIFPGMQLKVVTSEFSILVDKSAHLLALKIDDKILKTYKVSVGKGGYNSTPTGEFHITNKLVDPVWFKSGKVIPPEDPENILGSRWLGLSKKGYGIHGTTQPETIGKSITAGCIRMYDSDAKELYSIVPLGTKVTIIE